VAKAPAPGKARMGLYTIQGETLTRTHRACPKCGPGTFLAEHADRRSCGRCGYSESKAPAERSEKPAKAPKAPKAAPPAAAAPASG
jgi:small subunit ribosomal protein S27Ae